jgi:hypothetical protein
MRDVTTTTATITGATSLWLNSLPHERLALAVIARSLLDNDLEALEPWLELFGANMERIKQLSTKERKLAGKLLLDGNNARMNIGKEQEHLRCR